MEFKSKWLQRAWEHKTLTIIGGVSLLCALGSAGSALSSWQDNHKAELAIRDHAVNPHDNIASDLRTDRQDAKDAEGNVLPLGIAAGALGFAFVSGAVGVAIAGRREHDISPPITPPEAMPPLE